MALSNELISQFVKATQDKEETKKESTAYGKIVKQGDVEYVQLDGSDLLTPISSTTVVKDGDRVIVTIKNHEAIVTGDLTTPSASDKDVKEIGNKISEFEIVIADKVSTEQLEAEIAKIDKLVTDEFEATNAKIETMEGKVAKIDTIEADVVEVNKKITAHEGEFTTIRGEIAEFEDVTAKSVEAIEGDFYKLESDYADFKETTTNKITANEGNITKLQTDKLDVKSAEVTYANIDFSNIQEAAVEKLFTDSGIIKDLIMSEGKVTGELVGVTIKGDLIEGNTLKADKLVILGEDGLYYKLNVDALGETTASSDEKYQNGLDGSVIIAESITAEKISVDDLVAFGATIGGYRINEHALYSGTKNSVSNTTRGVFLGDDGQMAIGDSNNYLKFFKDTDGKYKLEIQASALKFGTSGTTVEEAINEVSNKAIISSVEQFYLSNSPTKLEGGSWSSSQPIWTEGKYIWRRTFVTKGDGTTEYQPSANGVCITGNTGAQGIQGPQGEKGETGATGKDGAAGATGKDGLDGKGINSITQYYLTSTHANTIIEWNGDPTGRESAYPYEEPMENWGMSGGFYKMSSNTPKAEDTIGWTYKVYWANEDGTDPETIEDEILNIDYVTDDKTAYILYGNFIDVIFVIRQSSERFPQSPGVYFMTMTGMGAYMYTVELTPTDIISHDTEGWTTEPQTVNSINKYLWNYESIEYTDGTITNTTPAVIGTYGEPGAPGPQGEDGNGIKSTEITYQISDSGSVIPTGTWSTTIPKTTADKPYFWTKTKITYTDDTVSETHTVGATPEGIVVGGRNLLLNSSLTQNHDQWTISGDSVEITTIDDVNCTHITGALDTTTLVSQDIMDKLNLEDLSQTYVYSADVRIDNHIAGTTNPFVKLYFSGYYDNNGTSTWLGATTVGGEPDIKRYNNQGWTRMYWVVKFDKVPTNMSLYIYARDFTGDLYFKNLKLEKGNKATDWTPAPEDVDKDISERATNEDLNEAEQSLGDRINEAQTTITALQGIISHLVTDANGGSLMTQTPDGWTFNMSSITGNLEAIQSAMENTNENQKETNEALQKLSDLVDDVVNKTAYVTISTDDNGDPCIELGKTDNEFKVRITNTAIDFLEGSTKIAYANNNTFYSVKIITQQIQIGDGPGFVWQTRANGNMGLTYISG